MLGVVVLRFRRIGAAGVLIFGVVGAVAAVTRPDSSGVVDALPSVVGALVAAALLHHLIGRLTGPPRSVPTRADAGRGPGWDRRGFVIGASAAAVGSLGVGALGRYLTDHSSRPAMASRNAVRLPAPASLAPPLPPGTQPQVPGISRFTTSNRSFYRVDTALVLPQVDAASWRLRIHGKGITPPAHPVLRGSAAP